MAAEIDIKNVTMDPLFVRAALIVTTSKLNHFRKFIEAYYPEFQMGSGETLEAEIQDMYNSLRFRALEPPRE